MTPPLIFYRPKSKSKHLLFRLGQFRGGVICDLPSPHDARWQSSSPVCVSHIEHVWGDLDPCAPRAVFWSCPGTLYEQRTSGPVFHRSSSTGWSGICKYVLSCTRRRLFTKGADRFRRNKSSVCTMKSFISACQKWDNQQTCCFSICFLERLCVFAVWHVWVLVLIPPGWFSQTLDWNSSQPQKGEFLVPHSSCCKHKIVHHHAAVSARAPHFLAATRQKIIQLAVKSCLTHRADKSFINKYHYGGSLWSSWQDFSATKWCTKRGGDCNSQSTSAVEQYSQTILTYADRVKAASVVSPVQSSCRVLSIETIQSDELCAKTKSIIPLFHFYPSWWGLWKRHKGRFYWKRKNFGRYPPHVNC